MRYKKVGGGLPEQQSAHEMTKSASFSYVNPKTEVRNSHTPNRIAYADKSPAANGNSYHSPEHVRSNTLALNQISNENSSRLLNTPNGIARMNSEVPQFYQQSNQSPQFYSSKVKQ